MDFNSFLMSDLLLIDANDLAVLEDKYVLCFKSCTLPFTYILSIKNYPLGILEILTLLIEM